MVSEDISISRSDLQGILRRIVHDGEWDFGKMADVMGAQQWMLWFRLRLDGQDPLFSYARSEREYGRGNLFHDLFYHLHHDHDVSHQAISKIRENASSGLDYFLQELNRRLTETSEGKSVRSERIHEALDLVGRTRTARTAPRDSVRKLLREWITSKQLLEDYPGSISPQLLHRSALFALAELQQPGDDRDRDIWEEWFEKNPYKLAAFSGMARSMTFEPALFNPDMPNPMEEWVGEVLRYASEKHERGEPVMANFALETLYMDDKDPEFVMRYLWEEAKRTSKCAETWRRLQDLLSDTDANLIDIDEMEDFADMFDRRLKKYRDLVPAGAGDEEDTGWDVFHA